MTSKVQYIDAPPYQVMQPSVEFPDAEVFGTKNYVALPIEEGHGDGFYDSSSRFMRTQSAKSKALGITAHQPRILPPTKTGRALSAGPKSRQQENAARKISRQTLRKPHLRAPPRTPSVNSDTSSLITAVGLETRKANNYLPDSPTPRGPPRPLPNDRWAVQVTKATEVTDFGPDHTDVEPIKRAQKIYPTFESWLAGPKIDATDYDTDLDIDDFVKNLVIRNKKRKKKKHRKKKGIEEDTPIDPTGKAEYKKECEKLGVAQVSYMQRHLGDKNLRMRHHYLGGGGTRPLAWALMNNTVTENLDLSDNYIESEGALYIAGMLRHNTFIINMNISSNFIGPQGFAAIARMLETNTTLKSLSVSGNQLTDSCAVCLVDALKNNQSLTSLDLSNNEFGENSGVYIGGALGINDSLVTLDLSWNAFRSKGATAVISGLAKNDTLETLDLSWNGCSLAGALALQQVLKVNTTLRVLDLTNNRIHTKAGEVLAGALVKNVGLETLILNQNPLKDAGVEAILKAAEKHTTLHFLSIEELFISRSNLEKIRTLEQEKDIIILHGGIGGYQRTTTATSMVNLFNKFLKMNGSDFETACRLRDRDRTGTLLLEEIKCALQEAGLRLTNKQVDVVLEEINYTNSNIINYKDILSGITLKNYDRRRPSRAFGMKDRLKNPTGLSGPLHKQLTVIHV